tara:strand:+ start:364 stop:579 length:216 start_codon:yes stop_codon:yes gene_type:complete
MNIDDYKNLKEFQKRLNEMPQVTADDVAKTLRMSIVGLCSVAIAHIDNGDIDKARETIMGTIIALEKAGEQ